MTNKKLLELTKEAQALFTVHKPGESENRPDGWVSFDTDNWDTSNPLYQVFSVLVRECSVDEDNAYRWTYDALGEIEEAIAGEEPDQEINRDFIEDALRELDRGLIYNYDIMQWAAKDNNWVLIDEVSEEFGGDLVGIIGQVNRAYAISQERQSVDVLNALIEYAEGQE